MWSAKTLDNGKVELFRDGMLIAHVAKHPTGYRVYPLSAARLPSRRGWSDIYSAIKSMYGKEAANATR